MIMRILDPAIIRWAYRLDNAAQHRLDNAGEWLTHHLVRLAHAAEHRRQRAAA